MKRGIVLSLFLVFALCLSFISAGDISLNVNGEDYVISYEGFEKFNVNGYNSASIGEQPSSPYSVSSEIGGLRFIVKDS